jgi:hypothetical protein
LFGSLSADQFLPALSGALTAKRQTVRCALGWQGGRAINCVKRGRWGERAPPPLIESGGSSLPQHSQSGDYAAVLAALSQSKNSARRGFFP